MPSHGVRTAYDSMVAALLRAKDCHKKGELTMVGLRTIPAAWLAVLALVLAGAAPAQEDAPHAYCCTRRESVWCPRFYA